jgi:hypothetical protein
MAANARRALAVREEKPPSQRGMTAVGLARARQLINREPLSLNTVRRMKAYFDRHEVDKQGSTWDDQGKGWQAWMGWGGDEGWSWARRILRQQERDDSIVSFVNASGRHNAPNYRLAPEVVATGEPMSLSDLEEATFNVCDNCGFEVDGVCALYRFNVDPDHVCDAWTSPSEVELIALNNRNANKFGEPDVVVENNDSGKA